MADMLATGANPNYRCVETGASPLHHAANNGFVGVVSVLLAGGVDKDALDNEAETPLITASDMGRACHEDVTGRWD